jgi:hypothetical protein
VVAPPLPVRSEPADPIPTSKTLTMTDHLASPGDDAVELASRYLDGDLGVDERAAAESDPEVMAWVERFGGIRTALREPVEVDAGRRDAAILAALSAAEPEPAETAPPPGGDELAAARARRAGRLGRWLGAAAAVVGLAIGGAVLAANSGGGDDSADETQLRSAAVEVAAATTEAGFDTRLAADQPASAEAPPEAMSATASPEADEARDGADTTAAGGEATSEPTAPDQAGTGGAAATTAAPATTAVATAATTAPEAYDAPSQLAPLATAAPVTTPEGGDRPCADQATGELVDEHVLYADQPAAVYRDVSRHTLTVWTLSTCEVLVEHPYPAG